MARLKTLEGFDHIFDNEDRVSHLDEAENRLRRFVASRDEKRVDFMEWALRIPEPKFGTLDFRLFPYQRELYSEGVYDEDGVIQKCSQVGASAWLVRWAIFWPDTKGRTSLYVFPRDEQGRAFSNQRIRPLIRGSEYLRERVPRDHINNVKDRQIGYGWLNLRGSQSVEGLESIDADALAMDEYDYLVPDNIPNAEKRISGPLSLGLIRRIGFPTVPGYGIARKYEQSDKRRWMVKCEGCGEWQDLDFWKNVDDVAMQLVCAACRKPLDAAKGEWVAQYPDRQVRGYHMTRLMVPNAKIAKIVEESKLRADYEVQNFYNRTLGLPYAAKEGRLSLEALAAVTRDYLMLPSYRGDNLVTMGIDVASVRNLNVRISEHLSDSEKRALWIGEVESFDDLSVLMDRYNVRMAAIDHLPEGRLARGFAEKYAGRVYVVSYAGPMQKDVITVDDEQRRVSVRRTEAMDSVIALIRSQRNLLPEDVPPLYAEHMQAPVRFIEKDDRGRIVVGYRSTGPDDFFHAESFDVIATECWWLRQAVDEGTREDESVLDEHLEFSRTHLDQVDEQESYSAGPDEGSWGADQGYHGGPDEGEWEFDS